MKPTLAELLAPERPGEGDHFIQILKMAIADRGHAFHVLGPSLVRKYKRPSKRWLESVRRDLVVAGRQGENTLIDILERALTEYEAPFQAMVEAEYKRRLHDLERAESAPSGEVLPRPSK